MISTILSYKHSRHYRRGLLHPVFKEYIESREAVHSETMTEARKELRRIQNVARLDLTGIGNEPNR